jgi:hypothetical protein
MIAVPKEMEDEAGREFGPQPSGGGNGLLQRRPLNHAFSDQPGDCLRRIRPAYRGERIERGRLFGHDPIKTKTGETPTQHFEGGDAAASLRRPASAAKAKLSQMPAWGRVAIRLSSSRVFHEITGRVWSLGGRAIAGPALALNRSSCLPALIGGQNNRNL